MPIAKVQLPDGRIARFEVAEGTTPDQVMEFANTQFTQKTDSKPDYKTFARQEAEKRGLDPDMFDRLIATESNWNPKALNKDSGAIGFGQLMPATAKELGVDPNDPYQNISGAAEYLSRQMKIFKRPELALAAYNAGPGRVREYGNQIPPFQETIAYVNKITGGKNTPASVDYSGMPEVNQNVAPGVARGVAGVASNAVNAASYPARVVRKGLGMNADDLYFDPKGIDTFMQDNLGTDTEDAGYRGGQLAGEVLATYPIGGLLGKGASAIPGVSPELVSSLSSGGMNVLGQAGMKGLANRMIGGGITGAASAGIVDPENTGFGAAIGAATPGLMRAAGSTMRGVGNALTGGSVSPEVAMLAKEAQGLGIDIPADRIANSRPLNALASSLNYVPLSGRAATESKMYSQVKRAVSNTFGEDTENITKGLRAAKDKLGGEFENVLSNNTVKVDKQFLDDLAQHAEQAESELGSDSASWKVISNQIDDILKRGENGEIEGKAAYNIKKTLDRIGGRNSNEAWYALDLKRSLMAALDRSLPPEESAAFAVTRKRYGNMLEIEKIALNGAEGDVSIARLANMKHINNPDLQKIADISSEFVKGREGAHGAAQRVFLGGASLAAPATWPYLAAGVAAGRGTNMLLNSKAGKNLVLKGSQPGEGQLSNALTNLLPFAYQGGQLSGR